MNDLNYETGFTKVVKILTKTFHICYKRKRIIVYLFFSQVLLNTRIQHSIA